MSVRELEKALTCDEAQERDEDRYKDYNNGYCQWSVDPNNNYYATYNTIPELKKGYYNIKIRDDGVIIFEYNFLKTDNLLNFPNSLMDSVLKEVNNFWDKMNVYNEYGFIHRRGYLLYGPAGSGKSCLIKLLINNLINRNGIILNGNVRTNWLENAIRTIRKIEPKRKIICLFEDIDSIIKFYGEEHILSFLDGQAQSEYILNIATTNYPEKLDKRIVCRPRRFDRVIKIDMPSKEMRKIFFKEKLKINGEELKKYVDNTDNFSFAAMAELVISTKCFDIDFEEALEKVKSLLYDIKDSDDYYGKKIGMG